MNLNLCLISERMFDLNLCFPLFFFPNMRLQAVMRGMEGLLDFPTTKQCCQFVVLDARFNIITLSRIPTFHLQNLLAFFFGSGKFHSGVFIKIQHTTFQKILCFWYRKLKIKWKFTAKESLNMKQNHNSRILVDISSQSYGSQKV